MGLRVHAAERSLSRRRATLWGRRRRSLVYVQPEVWLDEPAFYQFSVETWADDERMKHLPGLRPGGFITVYPSPDDQA